MVAKAKHLVCLLYPEKNPIVEVREARKQLQPETARCDKVFRVMSSIQPFSGMMALTNKYIDGIDEENRATDGGNDVIAEVVNAKEAVEVSTTQKNVE